MLPPYTAILCCVFQWQILIDSGSKKIYNSLFIFKMNEFDVHLFCIYTKVSPACVVMQCVDLCAAVCGQTAWYAAGELHH